METYRGWQIKVREGRDSFGDLTGCDAEASMERFCELLESYLLNDYPGAEIDIELVDATMRPVEVYSPAYEMSPENGDEEGDVRRGVDDVRERLFAGRLEDWAVEVASA